MATGEGKKPKTTTTTTTTKQKQQQHQKNNNNSTHSLHPNYEKTTLPNMQRKNHIH